MFFFSFSLPVLYCLILIFSSQAFLLLGISWPHSKFFFSGIPLWQILLASYQILPLRHSSPANSLGLISNFSFQAFLPSKFSWPHIKFSLSGIPSWQTLKFKQTYVWAQTTAVQQTRPGTHLYNSEFPSPRAYPFSLSTPLIQHKILQQSLHR